MPSISPEYRSKLMSSTTFLPSMFFTVRCLTSRRLCFSSTKSRLMSRVTFSPTISSVSCCSLVSCFMSVPTLTPLRNTLMRSEISMTSLSLWVMMTIALPSSLILRKIANRRRISCGVSTAVGSSSMRMEAPRYKVLTISSVSFSETDIS